MSREEAIYELKNAAWLGTDHSRARTEEALEMAIKALEQEPCDDAVSREYLKKIAQSEGAYGYVSAYDIATAPSVTQKPVECEDAISRQAAIDIIESWLSYDVYNYAERNIMRAMQSVLYDLPPVKPQEPQTGRWIMNRQLERRTCDNCNTEYRWSFYPHNYCPNCGAKMESEG